MNIESPSLSQSEIQPEAKDFLQSRGLIPPADIEFDSERRYRPLEGKPSSNKDGRYVGHENPHSFVLLVWNMTDGRDPRNPHKLVIPKNGSPLTYEQEQEDRAFEEKRQREREAEIAAEYAKKAGYAQMVAKSRVVTADPNHPYLIRKRVKPYDIWQLGKNLIVFGRDEHGKIWTYQSILPHKDEHGKDKYFLKGGRKTGSSHLIPGNGKNHMPHFCEGYATGADIRKATGANVYVCFDAGNLPVVVEAYLKKRPPGQGETLTMVICGDNDKWHYQWIEDGKTKQEKNPPEGAKTKIVERKDNPGRRYAFEAKAIAERVPGVKPVVVLPKFKNPGPDKSDFNDLAKEQGLKEVNRQINEAIKRHQEGGRVNRDTAGVDVKGDNRPKPEPEPLIRTPKQEKYPIHRIPAVMKASILEARKDTKSAIPLISAIHHSCLSYATQPLAMVRRDGRRVGPIGTFFLTVAGVNSGKTTNDDLLSTAIESHVISATEKMKKKVDERISKISSIESKIAGVKDRIRQLSKAGKDTKTKEDALKKLISEQNEIPAVYVPSLPLVDSSRQYIIKHLTQFHPSAAVITGEGGILLNSYAFSKEQITGTIHAWCDLWSGKTLDLNSVSRGRMIARGGKLTVGALVQTEQFERFLAKNENLYTLKDTGFFARTFMADAGLSKVGVKYHNAEKLNKVMAYKENLLKLLSTPLKFVDGVLTPDEMALSDEARNLWIEYYEETRDLPLDSDQYFHRFSGKGPENAARLACQYQLLENAFSPKGVISEVSKVCMENAIAVVKWYANEQARYFGEVDMPQELKDAETLDLWLREYFEENKELDSISKRDVQRLGPGGLRNATARRNAAIAELVNLNRIFITKKGKSELLQVHEKLRQLRQ